MEKTENNSKVEKSEEQKRFEYQIYKEEFYNQKALYAQNLQEQDKTLITLSAALMGILATLGKDVVLANKTLAILVFIFFAATIGLVLLGYFLSNFYFELSIAKLSKNFSAGKKLNEGMDEIWIGKINQTINHLSFPTFAVGIALFLALVFIYYGGL